MYHCRCARATRRAEGVADSIMDDSVLRIGRAEPAAIHRRHALNAIYLLTDGAMHVYRFHRLSDLMCLFLLLTHTVFPLRIAMNNGETSSHAMPHATIR